MNIAGLRKSLRRAAEHEPENARQFIAMLDKQLKGWGRERRKSRASAAKDRRDNRSDRTGACAVDRREDEMIENCKVDDCRKRELLAALQSIRNSLHAHNRPDAPLPNKERIRLRDLADEAISSTK